MSMIETYRRNVGNKSDEVVRFQQNKATESAKVAALSGKINAAKLVVLHSKVASTIKSKENEILRHQHDIASAEKKIADYESKIAKKQKEINDEKTKIAREENKVQKENQRQQEINQRKTNEHNRNISDKMSHVNNTIAKHEAFHRETSRQISELKKLPKQITILFLASNPLDLDGLRLDEEARAINQMIRLSNHRDSIKFETRWALQPGDLIQALNEVNPTIVHFSGHGSDSDEIVLQNADGSSKPVTKEAIIQTMVTFADKVQLVFFNTCFSGNQARAAVQHITAAIGMNTSIGDDAARIFASQFYSSIGFGHSLKKSFDQAKARLMLENIPEENTPELFIRDEFDGNNIVIVSP